MTLQQIYEDMIGRCAEVWIFHRLDPQDGGPSVPMGALLRCVDDSALAIELASDEVGGAQVLIRKYDTHGNLQPAHVIEAGGALMVTA
ncbi:MAG: hypothetical protein R8G01_01340 [Ilumatobacteraceae bacterium]|nr:hypothetical protein [Ilumatobacteraceae bacterium]